MLVADSSVVRDQPLAVDDDPGARVSTHDVQYRCHLVPAVSLLVGRRAWVGESTLGPCRGTKRRSHPH